MGPAKQVFTAMLWSVLIMPVSAWAAHPLITDDAGTQGTGKAQLEVNGQHDFEKETNTAGEQVKTSSKELAASLSYGIADSLDLVVGMPYLWSRTKVNGATTFSDSGIGDVVFEAKWRFYEKSALSFALKPGISIPTGDEQKGFGPGKTGYSLFFIASQEVKPWAVHVNCGYMRNENKLDEQKNLWHLSAAGTYALTGNMTAAANIGMERNTDTTVHQEPAFLLGGIIYSLNENVDIDFGVKYGMNDAETDLSYLAGAAFRF
jgi:hypothetical protein